MEFPAPRSDASCRLLRKLDGLGLVDGQRHPFKRAKQRIHTTDHRVVRIGADVLDPAPLVLKSNHKRRFRQKHLSLVGLLGGEPLKIRLARQRLVVQRNEIACGVNRQHPLIGRVLGLGVGLVDLRPRDVQLPGVGGAILLKK